MVRMAQEWSLRYLLIDGQGNFGSVDGDSPAAMRYTEARMQKIAEDLLVDIVYRNKDGQRVYPDTYIVREGSTLNYPSQNIKGNKVYWIPISELEVYE